ncbi:hypothetical protein SAMN04490182_2070 [Pseudomonas cedrina]|uniref:Uncharacterized protein n=2 Tax=Pseudomonas cedrina TaxID=651740 RepID=A0A1V2K1K6_PSECE|nr:hypothetical protein [Pseudomonas cedrina]ONH50976.1 hypothetical protein BLL36_24000 [Pseudomonas cedrina subsp. cedrina]SDS66054.1 hypothetical protein SAMN04490182_2070 [Pseudomonas cedrina]
MSQPKDLTTYNLYSHSSEDKRAIAVSAALALIHAKAANTPANCDIIKDEMARLGAYADQIQEALKVK